VSCEVEIAYPTIGGWIVSARTISGILPRDSVVTVDDIRMVAAGALTISTGYTVHVGRHHPPHSWSDSNGERPATTSGAILLDTSNPIHEQTVHVNSIYVG